MDIILINRKDELLRYEAQISVLFSDCFGCQIPPGLWHWAYIDNPFGNPVVALCLEGKDVVAHYATIPLHLNSGPDSLKSFLSMTTMVATTHRKFGLFTNLAGEVYRELENTGADIVMGFPNKLSAPGFRKRLSWEFPPADYIACVDKEQLLSTAVKIFSTKADNSFSLDLMDKHLRDWRLAKPGVQYVWRDGLVFKEFDGAMDLIYFSGIEALENLPSGVMINLLVPHDVHELVPFKVFDYQFGGLSIKKGFSALEINRQMCLSDVF